MRFTIYTDGACANHGGEARVSGYAAIVHTLSRPGDIILQEMVHTGHELDSTNNRSEVLAAIAALENLPDGRHHIEIISDSQYLVYTMCAGWKRNKNHDLWGQLEELIQGHRIRWTWVRGHNGNKYNERADKLAVEAKKLGESNAAD